MNKIASISAITIAASAGFATAGSLDLDRAYATELRSDAGAYSVLNSRAANLEVTAGARFGYNINVRDNNDLASDDETTIGFGFEDVEVRLSGQVTDSINATISFDFGPGEGIARDGRSGMPSSPSFFDDLDESGVNLEDAYADWMINDGFTLRIGQFVQAFSAGRSISEYHMMGAYRSSAQEVLGDTGWTQGVEAHFGGDTWSGVVGFNDGPFTGNSAFNSAAEADFAFNARFDFFSDADKARFNDRTSWRGASNAWRIGAGAFWASYGSTNPSGSDDDIFGYTIDAAYESDGWAVYGAFFGQHLDIEGASSMDNFGFELGASMFFNDQFEGFARYDVIIFDEDFLGTEDTFNAVNVGINYYFVPESHAAKFTAELGWAFDDTQVGDPTVNSFPALGGGYLGNSDGELNLAFMFQFMF